ncbi:hypothetical protein PAXRUDRAFT_602793 [Paxillus rubicundulus Ve08.2h10]|uniref:Uncharacterized protein n=1 Tax=Paxillus rubicundulus Ve08.2h10 TaxID=930991 RepID=A0A0D0E492_9AGAM|nr:hypothetical protein PAXRUDRAFT_602793 [Paxillus rubicundulus Ve08.2h10]
MNIGGAFKSNKCGGDGPFFSADGGRPALGPSCKRPKTWAGGRGACGESGWPHSCNESRRASRHPQAWRAERQGRKRSPRCKGRRSSDEERHFDQCNWIIALSGQWSPWDGGFMRWYRLRSDVSSVDIQSRSTEMSPVIALGGCRDSGCNIHRAREWVA